MKISFTLRAKDWSDLLLDVYDHVACPADRKIFDPQGNVQESQILDVLKEKHKVMSTGYQKYTCIM